MFMLPLSVSPGQSQAAIPVLRFQPMLDDGNVVLRLGRDVYVAQQLQFGPGRRFPGPGSRVFVTGIRGDTHSFLLGADEPAKCTCPARGACKLILPSAIAFARPQNIAG